MAALEVHTQKSTNPSSLMTTFGVVFAHWLPTVLHQDNLHLVIAVVYLLEKNISPGLSPYITGFIAH